MIHVMRNKHEGTVTAHTHEFYEFVCMIDGFSLHTYNGSMSVLTAGDIFFVRPGDIHGYTAASNARIFNCLFCIEALGPLGDDIARLAGAGRIFRGDDVPEWKRIHLEPAEYNRVYGILETMERECASPRDGSDLYLKGLLISFLVLFSRYYERHYHSGSEGAQYLGYIQRALGHIENRYASDLSVADIATHIGISADYLTRQFRQVLGVTPVEYIRNFRFARSMELMRTTHLSIGETARAVGYNHLSHFTREFKNLLGKTPSEYRKENYGI